MLGTVDQLLIDNCITGEVTSHKRNLAVAFYDYQKAYDMVRHDWMLRVYKWMGFPKVLCNVIEELMKRWKTRLELNTRKKTITSRWIEIKKGFLQGDSFSPVGFCLTEVPVMMLLEETDGYRMGAPGERTIIRTHSLFIDDLKVYQENHKKLEVANGIIVEASHDTGACYGVKKCAEVVYKRGKMIKGEGLAILEETMKSLDPNQNEVYKFLGCEQGEEIDINQVIKRITNEVKIRMKQLVKLKLYDKNLIKAINSRVIPVVSYVMNVCKFTKTNLDSLDGIIKKILRENMMHGRQSSNERLYLKRENGGRGLKSLHDVYQDTKVRIACYMTSSDSKWIRVAWKRELNKEGPSIKNEAEELMKDLGIMLQFSEQKILLNNEEIVGPWKNVWKKLKKVIHRQREEKRINEYQKKTLQSEIYRGLDDCSHQWLSTNIDPKKVSAIIGMQEQMVETRAWKKLRGLEVTTELCRLCSEHRETVHHLLSGCKVLAAGEYLKRHNNCLMVLAVEWCKMNGLIPKETNSYNVKWCRGTVLSDGERKMIWDFEYQMRKTTTARRPDLILEDNMEKKIFIIDMACPNESNIAKKRREKLDKYQQLAFEIREKRKDYMVEILPIVIGCMGGGMKEVEVQVGKIITDKKTAVRICTQMQKVVLFHSESTLRKVLSGIVQRE